MLLYECENFFAATELKKTQCFWYRTYKIKKILQLEYNYAYKLLKAQTPFDNNIPIWNQK